MLLLKQRTDFKIFGIVTRRIAKKHVQCFAFQVM